MNICRHPHKASRHSYCMCVSPPENTDCVMMWLYIYSQWIKLNPSIMQATWSSCENSLFLFYKLHSCSWPLQKVHSDSILCPCIAACSLHFWMSKESLKLDKWMKHPTLPLTCPFDIHQPTPYPSRPPYSMELCTGPLVIWLYIEGKGGARF